jgi:hypothetical protein
MTAPTTNPPSGARLFLTLAALWVAAGALFKLFAGTPADLPPTIQEFPLLRPAWSFRLAIGIELSIVILAFLRPRCGAKLLILMFIAFDLLLMQMMRSGDASCGCFGSKVPIEPWMMMVIDSALLAGLVLRRSWRVGPEECKSIVKLLPLFALVLIYPWFKFGEETLVVDTQGADWHHFTPSQWEGEMIHDLDLVGFFEDPSVVDQIPPPAHVILYRLSCEHCKEHFEKLMVTPIVDRPIVLIEIPENEGDDVTDVVSSIKPQALLEIKLKPMPRGYGITTPVTFDVDDLFTVQNVTEHTH